VLTFWRDANLFSSLLGNLPIVLLAVHVDGQICSFFPFSARPFPGFYEFILFVSAFESRSSVTFDFLLFFLLAAPIFPLLSVSTEPLPPTSVPCQQTSGAPSFFDVVELILRCSFLLFPCRHHPAFFHFFPLRALDDCRFFEFWSPYLWSRHLEELLEHASYLPPRFLC